MANFDDNAEKILAKRKPGDGADAPEVSPKRAAMEEFIAAVKDGDTDAACDAFDALNACGAEE